MIQFYSTDYYVYESRDHFKCHFAQLRRAPDYVYDLVEQSSR